MLSRMKTFTTMPYLIRLYRPVFFTFLAPGLLRHMPKYKPLSHDVRITLLMAEYFPNGNLPVRGKAALELRLYTHQCSVLKIFSLNLVTT
jgi:hypothetical protein